MKTIYPVILTPIPDDGYMVYVPDLNINTQGDSLGSAIDMARDAISITCVDLQDDGKALPEPSLYPPHSEDELVAMLDVDLDAYRRSLERRTVRRNVSLPAWLDKAAKESDINVSSVLVKALKEELNLVNY